MWCVHVYKCGVCAPIHGVCESIVRECVTCLCACGVRMACVVGGMLYTHACMCVRVRACVHCVVIY